MAQILFFVLVVRPFLALFLGLRVRGRDRLPRTDPFVLIANHSSHLDTAALLTLFPLARLRRIRPVAAADYFEANRLRSWFARTFFRILPIERHAGGAGEDPRAAMLRVVRGGESLILFPEGTRGEGGGPGHFRSGVAHLASEAPEVPIVPVYLRNLGRILPKGRWVPLPLFCEAHIGEALHPTGSREEIVAALEEAVRALRDGEAAAERP